MTRDNETWVQNIFVKMYGIEAFMPEVKGSLLENGYKITDLKRVESKTRNLRSMPKAWRWVAKQQEDMAREAEEKGIPKPPGCCIIGPRYIMERLSCIFTRILPRRKPCTATLFVVMKNS